MRNAAAKRGFTLLEFLVGLAIVVILAGIILPFSSYVREKERRTRCADNLWKLGFALTQYGGDNRYELPRVIYKDGTPETYTAFTGPDASDPFAADGRVAANDVSASLWLLIRNNYVPSDYSPASSLFICPSSSDVADPLTNSFGQHVGARERGNFRGPKNLSYSYASPFSNATGYGLKSDFLPKDFVLLADKSPGRSAPRHDVTAPTADQGPLQLKVANSRNHGQAGQNVLFGDMHVEFRITPYCGVDQDNIYTAVAEKPIDTGELPVPNIQGFFGRGVAPAWPTDSYLVPAESEFP